MLPRVKLYFAIALGLCVFSLLFTGVRIPATVVAASAASPKPIASPLIAFRPFVKKGPGVGWLGASAAEADVLPVVVADVYEDGKKRYDVHGQTLTGHSGAGGDGEKIVFGSGVRIMNGTPPPRPSGFPLYLELASRNKPCWHLVDTDLTWHSSATSIEHHRLGKLVDSTNLPVCRH